MRMQDFFENCTLKYEPGKEINDLSRNWTSDYDGIDKFIQNTRPPAINQFEVLEWIPYDEFCDIEYIAKGDFETLYRAKDMYDVEIMKIRNWDRFDSNEFVVLKSLNNSENVAYEFINEVPYLYDKFIM
ncbi:hypothetical protein RclHR1_15950002 [Rhizophagus clarus]|uniref:Protein kinase domain-containing protein n=1 Tax=Rhizophagus clarus TaxID=94130 RepID=A0A2Z6R978_9GLOM|nr:hypothetical protein RclHR1_15950002 [Rhizophagus clarus]